MDIKFTSQEIEMIRELMVEVTFSARESQAAKNTAQRIIDKLNERIDTFRDSGNDNFEDIADLLEIALDENLDELVKNVVNSLETYKIKSSEKFNEDDEDSDLYSIEIN
jgi:hypothetical protein